MKTASVITVRPISPSDIPEIVNYWLHSNKDFLISMGVDLSKLPNENQLEDMLTEQIKTPLEKKKSFALICCMNDESVGHCNIVDIDHGEEAYMHLHLWKNESRKKGIGTSMVKKSVEQFFDLFNIKRIISEPYSQNPAPHKALLKAGFMRDKEYVTTPGSLSFRQTVVRYVLNRDQSFSEEEE